MKIRHKANGTRMFWCPGCECVHRFNDTWVISGTDEAPTVTPSLLVTGWIESQQFVGARCHSFIRDGKIQFLEDCGHKLKGLTVLLPDLPVGEE